MELYYYGLTDPGMIRANNEDYLFAGKIRKNEYLFIVADGMGGHQAGEVASRKAVSLFIRQVEKQKAFANPENSSIIPGELERIVININETLMQEGNRSPKKSGMGTTLSALYINNDRGYIVHVGDSRIYLLTGPRNSLAPHNSPGSGAGTNPGTNPGTDPGTTTKQLRQLTEDHSFVAKLLKDGLITEEEARSHPKRNVLYQSVGIKPDITIYSLDAIPLRKGQKFLLCSDGLYGVVPDQEIKEYLSGHSTELIAQQLVKRAKFNGGPDNISVIVVSTEKNETLELTDTVKIPTPPPKKRKKNKLWRFMLLVLLVLLLALMIYFLLLDAGDNAPPLPGTGETSIAKTLGPGELPGKR